MFSFFPTVIEFVEIFNIDSFQNANKDFDLLFTLMTYPTEKLHKIHFKQAENFILVGEFEKGRSAYNKTLEHLLSQPKPSQTDIGEYIYSFLNVIELPYLLELFL